MENQRLYKYNNCLSSRKEKLIKNAVSSMSKNVRGKCPLGTPSAGQGAGGKKGLVESDIRDYGEVI